MLLLLVVKVAAVAELLSIVPAPVIAPTVWFFPNMSRLAPLAIDKSVPANTFAEVVFNFPAVMVVVPVYAFPAFERIRVSE